MLDIKNIVGAYDISKDITGVAFDLLDPNNPIYMLAMPGLDETVKLKGKDYKDFSQMLKALDVNFEVEIKTGDEDDPYQNVELTFDQMSDFQKTSIIKRVKALKKLEDVINFTEAIVRKAQADSRFSSIFEEGNESAKNDLLTFLKFRISQLKGE